MREPVWRLVSLADIMHAHVGMCTCMWHAHVGMRVNGHVRAYVHVHVHLHVHVHVHVACACVCACACACACIWHVRVCACACACGHVACARACAPTWRCRSPPVFVAQCWCMFCAAWLVDIGMIAGHTCKGGVPAALPLHTKARHTWNAFVFQRAFDHRWNAYVFEHAFDGNCFFHPPRANAPK